MTRHAVTRLRREPQRRTLTVASTERLGATMLRIGFRSDELEGFDSPSPDDHVKLFLPGDGEEGGRPAMRDYTPRAWDVAAGTFVIDFALHGDGGAGPATAWAMAAAPGDRLQIGGPRGSAVIADDFDWYLLVGDATALPSIGRRLEELRAGVPVTVVVLAEAEDGEVPLPTREHTDVRRVAIDADAATIVPGPLPAGEGYVWIAAEASTARAVRAHVVDTLGQPREWVKAAGYWTRGVADAHERIGD